MYSLDRSRLEDNHNCFACGSENTHGLHMQVSYTTDQAVCRISLPRRFQGWVDMAHGGVINTMMDEIMAYAVLNFVGLGVTAAMETRFRKPTPLQTELIVTGWVDKKKRRLALTKATVCLASEPDKPLAEASAKFFLQAAEAAPK